MTDRKIIDLKKEKESFFESIVKPYHYAARDNGNWYICNLDWSDHRYVLFSNGAAKLEPFLINCPEITVNDAFDVDHKLKDVITHVDNSLAKQRQPLDILQVADGKLFLITDIPIILPATNSVVAFFSLMRVLENDKTRNIMQKHSKVITNSHATVLSSNYNSPVLLNEREEQILYFLLNGNTQYEIAEVFKVSRGYISNTIALMCQKFGIAGSSYKAMLEKARHYNYHLYIPRSLL